MAGIRKIINYKSEVINDIKNSDKIISLISGTPNIDMTSEAAKKIINENFLNYTFNEESCSNDKCAVYVECKMNDTSSCRINNIEIIVQIISAESILKLDKEKFPNIDCNRNDAIAAEIAELIDGADIGVGELRLIESAPCDSPAGTSLLQLRFAANDFR